MARPTTGRLAVLLLLVAAGVLLTHAAFYPDCLSDDAFISFRYAANWAGGHGPVFNPGEPQPVEGYTNFLWTALLAAAIKFGFDPETASRTGGLLFALLAQGATFLLMRAVRPDRPWLWAVPAGLLATNSYFVVEAIQGLETTLFAFLLTAGLVAMTAPAGTDRDRGRDGLAAGGLFGLAALTRPEGLPLFLVALAVGLLLQHRAQGRWNVRAGAMTCIIVLAFTCAHLAFRLTTYGDWLPNTFYAKTGGGLQQALRGAVYVASGWWRLLPWPLLALVALLPRASGGTWRLAMVWLVSTAGVVMVGGDFKPTFRFIVWTLPLLASLVALGLARVASLSSARLATRQAAVLALLMVTLAWGWNGSRQGRMFASQRTEDLTFLRQAADWFDAHLPADAIIATGPSGAIPYYTERETVDMWGLNHRGIARRTMPAMGDGTPGHEKGDGRAVLAARPDVVLFTALRFTREPFPGNHVTRLLPTALSVSERELLALPGFHRSYRWRSVPLQSTTLNFFERTASGETD